MKRRKFLDQRSVSTIEKKNVFESQESKAESTGKKNYSENDERYSRGDLKINKKKKRW